MFFNCPDYRRKGIAKEFVKYLCDDFFVQDYDIIEAYPRKDGRSDAENYHGPLKMYLDSGFEIVMENESFTKVRKKLKD